MPPHRATSNRYQRQIALPEIGPEGQARIESGSVLCVGAGGLGSPALLYLAAAGVGRIGIVDPDKVDETNLQRQVLFDTSDLGSPKSDAALKRLRDLNPAIEVTAYPTSLRADNALEILSRYDVIVDGTDNFAAKFLINDAGARLGKPVVHGSISKFEGRVSVFWRGRGPCYRCLYPKPPEAEIANCAETGVIGGVAGIVGSAQAMEALKLLVFGEWKPEWLLIGRLLAIDALTMSIDCFEIATDPACPICSASAEQIPLQDLATHCLAGNEVEASAVPALLAQGAQIIDIREQNEWLSGHIPGSLHWPLSKMESGELPAALGMRLCILYCATGKRSSRALALLSSKGITEAKHLRGGLRSWTGPLASSC